MRYCRDCLAPVPHPLSRLCQNAKCRSPNLVDPDGLVHSIVERLKKVEADMAELREMMAVPKKQEGPTLVTFTDERRPDNVMSPQREAAAALSRIGG